MMGIGFHPSIRSMTTRRFVKFFHKRRLQLATYLQWLLSSQLSPALGIEPSLHLAHWDINLPKPKPLNSFLTAPLVHLRCSLNFTCIISQNLLFVKQNFEDFQKLSIVSYLPLQSIIPKRFHLVQNFKKQWIRFNIVHCIKIPTK